MKPIYFPFTYISEPVLEAFSAFFKQIVVYQPSSLNIPESMQKLTDGGLLEIRIPVKGDENKIDNILKDYKSWANIHQGSELAFFKMNPDKIPFFDDSSALQIKADIKKKKQKQEAEKKQDLLLNAKIFLHIAQEFDMQNWEINRDLLLLEEKELNLIDNLKGEDELSFKENNKDKTGGIDSQSDYMTIDRIIAWTHLLQYDQDMSGLFITNNRSAIEHIIEKTPEAKIVLNIDSIPLTNSDDEKREKWQNSLSEQLELIIGNSLPASEGIKIKSPFDKDDGKKVSLTLYLIQDESPYKFFTRSTWHKTPVKGTNKEAGVNNTLIGFVE
ncbi:MAG: hypothetical protein KKH84_05305 [Proteobacteria bacterium]|nr:hypothetical protein [Pseudomonadota bacterium]MBU4420407.1 hypothetical protein [Pseudomonadota bacterium]MCG2830719.1 hypothetical protein [Desulfobacteraceae bacterium]